MGNGQHTENTVVTVLPVPIPKKRFLRFTEFDPSFIEKIYISKKVYLLLKFFIVWLVSVTQKVMKLQCCGAGAGEYEPAPGCCCVT